MLYTQRTSIRAIAATLAMLTLTLFLLAACGRNQPEPTAEPTAAPTSAPPTATPAPTEPAASAAEPEATSAPVTTTSNADVFAEVADAGAYDGVSTFTLDGENNSRALWVAHTIGMRGFDPDQPHIVAIYTQDDGEWREITRITLGDEELNGEEDEATTAGPDYLAEGSVYQVTVDPASTWLAVDGGLGAHSGSFHLLRFDDDELTVEAAGFSASPGAGSVRDLDGDGIGEVILDATDYYVFCYACGVRNAQFELLRWDGTQMVPVELTLMPDDSTAPAAVQAANDQAVALAEAGLWKGALDVVNADLDPLPDDPIARDNALLIRLNAEAKQAMLDDKEPGYPILENVFYGDYPGAVDIMRNLPSDQIFSDDTSLITDTVAAGGELVVADWITRSVTSALPLLANPAPAYFLRGWANFLLRDDNAALADLQDANRIKPGDPLYRESLALLGGVPVEAESTAATSDDDTAGDDATTTADTADDDSDDTAADDVPADDAEVVDENADADNTEESAAEAESSAEEATPALVAAPATGGRLFFSAQDEDGVNTIFQLNGDGTVAPIVAAAVQPALQPGGQRLAFFSKQDDTLGLGGYDLPTDERVRFSFNIEDSLPTWDPTTEQIVFASTRYGDGRWRLYQVWADGRGDAVDLGYGQDPDWHPAEARIVYRGCDDSGGNCGLWTMAPDGTARASLTDNPGDARPVWSPDGAAVVFMSDQRDGNWELYRVETASGAVTRLTDNPALDGLPEFSPEGSQIAFMSNRDGVWSIQVMPSFGGVAQTRYEIGDNVADWLEQGIAWEE